MNINPTERQSMAYDNYKRYNTQNEYNKVTSPPKVDLSKIDASEKTMSLYTYPKEFLKLNLDKIREFIDIFEEYYLNLIEQKNIEMAKAAKQRLILLKNLEKEKMKIEAKIIYSNQKELILDKMEEELNSFIKYTNSEYDSLLQAFEKQEIEMIKAQVKELDEYKNNFEILYEIKKPKPSRQILNWIKIRDYAVKQNIFDKVEEANKEINKLQKKYNEKIEIDKKRKKNIEIKNILKKHDNEKNALKMKKESFIDAFNQIKNKKIEQIKKKYQAKMKEIKNYQNFEISNFDKIIKGITKPCARIQSIVKSALTRESQNHENEMKRDEYVEEEEIGDEHQTENEKKNKNEEKREDETKKNNNNYISNDTEDRQEKEDDNKGNIEEGN